MINYRDRIVGIIALILGLASLLGTILQVYNQEVLIPQLQTRVRELKTQNPSSISQDIDNANQGTLLVTVVIALIGATTTIVGGLIVRTMGDERSEFTKQKYLSIQAVSEAVFRLRNSRKKKDDQRLRRELVDVVAQHSSVIPNRILELLSNIVFQSTKNVADCDLVLNSCKKYLSAEKVNRNWNF